MRAAQETGVRALAGLSRERTDAAAWTVTTDPESAVGGARAVALLVAVSWQSSLPLLPWKVPGVPRALDRAYEFVADRRHRLPGETPWCDAHPGVCESTTGDDPAGDRAR